MVGLGIGIAVATVSLVGAEADVPFAAGEAALGADLAADATADATADDVADVAARRVYIRKAVRQEVERRTARDDQGRFLDANTGEPIDGQYDLGHVYNQEWWRTQQMARDEGWTRQQLIEYENNPDRLQIENPSTNRCHKFESPR